MSGVIFIFLALGFVGVLFVIRNANKDHWE